jgi:hypothetical protein
MSDQIQTIGFTIISTIIGGLITWYFSYSYYIKAGRELVEETRVIKKLLECVVLLEGDDKKQYRVNRDDEGKIVGLNAEISTNLSGNSSLNASVEKENP